MEYGRDRWMEGNVLVAHLLENDTRATITKIQINFVVTATNPTPRMARDLID